MPKSTTRRKTQTKRRKTQPKRRRNSAGQFVKQIRRAIQSGRAKPRIRTYQKYVASEPTYGRHSVRGGSIKRDIGDLTQALKKTLGVAIRVAGDTDAPVNRNLGIKQSYTAYKHPYYLPRAPPTKVIEHDEL